MAVDFNKPYLADTAFQDIRDLCAGLALGLDTTVANTPVGAIRWSSANSRWEKFNGSTWAALASRFFIDVDTVDGLHASDFALANHDHAGVYQPLDATLTALAGLGASGGMVPRTTGTDAYGEIAVSDFMATVLDDTSANAALTTLGGCTTGKSIAMAIVFGG